MVPCKEKIAFGKGILIIVAISIFLGVSIFFPGMLEVTQARVVNYGEKSHFSLAPRNPDYISYLEDIKVGKLQGNDTGEDRLGFIPPLLDLPQNGDVPYRSEFPASYDLREKGKLTPIKDQGACGSCWTFATYGAMESYLLPGQQRDFSENHMKNTHGFDLGPCQGGNQFLSTAYLARWSGPVAESQDPYSPYDDSSPTGLTPQKHVQNAYFIPDRSNSLDNDAIKQAIMDYGAVFTSMYYGNGYFDPDHSSYYFNGSLYSNHAVTIVGWDDNFDRNKFTDTPPGDGAYIVKNSWGTGWGENGYFYISYYDSNVGQDNVVFTADPVSNFNTVYQYDPYGWISSIGESNGSNSTMWFANVFHARENEALRAVSFYNASPSASYKISIYTGVTSGPESGIPAESQTGTLSNPGYNTVMLNKEVSLTPGEKFSVVVKLTTPGYGYPCPVEYADPGYSSAAASGPGESWASTDGSQWIDLHEKGFGNACLKAFTVKSTGPGINVISPGGGENWAAGSTQSIRWSYTGDPGPQVKIDLLKDGNLFDTVTSGTSKGNDGSGTFSWAIPEGQPAGNDYKIRITSTSDSSYTATSVESFTITGPGLTVTSPSGGERWKAGTTRKITWDYSGNIGNEVMIELLKGGNVFTTITTATPVDDEHYPWTIPAGQVRGDDYQIRITGNLDDVYTDAGENFSIIAENQQLALFIHDGSENSHHLADTSEDGYSKLKEILYSKGIIADEKNPVPITPSLLSNYDIVVFASIFKNREISQAEADALIDFVNRGGKLFLIGEWNFSANWKKSFNKIGSAFGIESDFNRITDPTDYKDKDFWPVISDIRPHPVTDGVNKFVLPSASSLTLTSPAAAVAFTDQDATPPEDVALAASQHNSGKIFAAVGDSNFLANRFINLYDNRTLASNIFDWLAGEPNPPESGITVTAPNGGENWQTGSTHLINWNYSGNPGPEVKIELLGNGIVNRVITSATPIGNNGSGSFSWTIPETQVPGSEYKVKISSISDSSYWDSSDSNFTISKPATKEIVMGFDPPEITVYKNPSDPYSDEFTVNVKISNLADGQRILGFHNVIHFDPDLMEVVEVELLPNSFLNPVLFSDKEIDNAKGRIEFYLARSSTDYPGHTGLVFTITLRAKEKGTAALEHFIADLRDADNQTLPAGSQDGKVEILSLIGDFVNDGTIDSQDLAIFNQCWMHEKGDSGWEKEFPEIPGSPFKQADIGPATGTPPELDIEPDGVVNFDDLLVFAWMWNWANSEQPTDIGAKASNVPSCGDCRNK